ncbi:MAG: peptidyl-prolyl cis-trans isomerase [Bacteroidota bacterium]
MRPTDAILLALLVLAGAGCQKAESPQTPVARIDNRTLTLETVRAQLDSTHGISEAQLQEFIRRWINNEILFREAVRRGLDRDETVNARLEEVKRQLAINALLDQEIYNEKTLASSPEEVEAYYGEHQSEFTLPGDLALVSFVLFSDRDEANTFRTAVLRGTPWGDAMREVLGDPQASDLLVAHVDSMYYTQSTLFPAELWRVAVAAKRSEPSFPIRTDDGFYILIPWKLNRQGQTPDLAYVEQEIRSRLAMARRQRLLTTLIENLRARHAVEILIQSGSGESTVKEEE